MTVFNALRRSLKAEYPFIAGILAIVWQLLFFCLPLVTLLALSFSRSLTILPFFEFVYVRIIARSLLLALCTAFSCFMLGYPLSYWMARLSPLGKTIAFFFLVLPFWTNFLLHIFAWFFVLERQGFINETLMFLGILREPLLILNTWYAVIIMMIYYYLPFYVLPLYASLEKFDWQLIEASRDLGATWAQTVQRIMIPQTRQAIISGFFLVFIPAYGEFIIPELMGGDKSMTVGSVISQLILNPQTLAQGATFVTLSSLILILVSYGMYYLLGRSIYMMGKGYE